MGAASLALLSARDWHAMPTGFRCMAFILVPAFAFFAFYWPIWEKTTKFIADKRGVFFPCNELLVHAIGQARRKEWLLVSWDKVSNIHTSEEFTYEGSSAACVAFDVAVTPEEDVKFFKHVGTPVDQKGRGKAVRSVAYSDFPLAPEETVKLLRKLKAFHGTAEA